MKKPVGHQDLHCTDPIFFPCWMMRMEKMGQ
jgi:hypothetical protein